MIRSILLMSLFVCCFLTNKSQNSAPEFPRVGSKMPEFTITDIKGFSKKIVSLTDFKGKWLILDWWTQSCAVCIESFPKMSELQQEFSKDIQILMIAYTGKTAFGSMDLSSDVMVRRIHDKANQKYHFNMPFAFDSILYKRYNLGTTPYIVIIDPSGIVRGVTEKITSKDLRSLLAGQPVSFVEAYRRDQTPKYDQNLPYLTFGNGGIDTAFLYRSLLAKWNQFEQGLKVVDKVEKGHVFETFGIELKWLYQLAYMGQCLWFYTDSAYGKISPRVILEVKDTSAFCANRNTGDGYYNYSLIIPPIHAGRDRLMKAMQRDLQTYFGYKAVIEIRKMPYWRLISKPGAVEFLRTKGAAFSFKDYKHIGFEATNYPIRYLIGFLHAYNQKGDPFVDETGINENIDISVQAVLTDFNDFKRALNENGMDLVKGEKEMKVLVIKDVE